MGKISLQGLAFKAYHGYYDEEREQGNHFEVNLTVKTDFAKASKQDDLDGTVDYERLYAIVKDEMGQPAKLLEHVADRIVTTIMDELKAVSKIKLSLSKFDPPIGGACRAATITVKRKRD